MMSDSKSLDVLKSAILLESRGKAFYTKVAEHSENSSVREFFQLLAEEEDNHLKVLSEQFKAVKENNRFTPVALEEKDDGSLVSQILTDGIKERISAAGFEAAAISAAMSMEEHAIKLYAERAKSATDPEEKALYDWLAHWERSHLAFLSRIDKELTQKIWFDNQFWPF
jgi:rubrerythrin